MRLNWKNTFLIGLGFFSVGLVWPIYNIYMPLFYDRYIDSDTIIGWLMTVDNVLALTLTPLVGVLSDQTRTRYGRRIPYLLVGAPLAAIFMALIPVGWETGLVLLIAFAIMMNLAMASFRSPIVALMPDVTPPELRSKANGIINFMGGLGFVAATFGGAILYDMYEGGPFFGAALMLVLVALAFFLFIREPENATEQTERWTFGFVRDWNALFMLLAIFCWFVAYNSIEQWISIYGTRYLGHQESDIGKIVFFSGGAFLIMALPAGYIAEGFWGFKGFGRKWTILIGLAGMVTAAFLLNTLTDLWAGIPLLVLYGTSWAWVNINSYPMIVGMAPEGQIGTYTGLYYLFQNTAMIAGPPLFGWVFDRWGYGYFFPLAIAFLVLAALFIVLVRKGDVPRRAETSAAD